MWIVLLNLSLCDLLKRVHIHLSVMSESYQFAIFFYQILILLIHNIPKPTKIRNPNPSHTSQEPPLWPSTFHCKLLSYSFSVAKPWQRSSPPQLVLPGESRPATSTASDNAVVTLQHRSGIQTPNSNQHKFLYPNLACFKYGIFWSQIRAKSKTDNQTWPQSNPNQARFETGPDQAWTKFNLD